MCCGGGGIVSRLGVTAGLLSLLSVVSAVLTGSWLYTREPLSLPGSKAKSHVTFKIGLWRVCASLKRVLTSPPNTLLPMPGCQLIPYRGWREVKEADLGITWSALEFTPTFITKMRYAAPLVSLATVMLALATILAMLGHCRGDLKTLAACGLYTLGGLVLASGLVVFVAALSDVTADRTRHSHLEHRYGTSFHAAAAACVLSQAAALLSVVAYLHRFPTVEDMVRAAVPGADRKLRLCSRGTLVLSPPQHPRYTTIIHQGLLGVAEGSTSSSSPSCSSHSLPRHPRTNPHSDTLPLPPRHSARCVHYHKSFSLPRRHPIRPPDSPSSESQNT